MPNGLITLHTDLKSLKYGTMPLGSDKPYVTKNIGQAPGSQIGSEISHRIDDVSRIAQMLVDKPGIKYLLHEAELQQIGVGQRIKKAQKGGKSLVGAVLGQIGNTLIGTAKIAASTLAQVPVNGTGTHFLKGFRTDTYLSDGKTHSGFAAFFGAGGVEGAQYALNGKTVPNTINNDYENFGETSKITGKFNPAPSLFDYNAKVDSNLNEVANVQKPEWASKQFYNSTLSSKGKVVPLGKTEIRPVQARNADTMDGVLTDFEKRGELTFLSGFNTPFQQPSIETTATPNLSNANPKQNLIKSIPHTGSIAGDVNPDSSTNIPSASYSYEKTYTGKEASTSITNAQTGAPIPTQFTRETTEKIKGSLSSNASGQQIATVPSGSGFKDVNTFTDAGKYREKIVLEKQTTISDVEGTPIELSKVVPDSGNIGNDGKQKYKATKTYTGADTKSNIRSALTGSTLPTGGTVPTNSIRHEYSSIAAASEVAKKNHKSQHNPQLGRTYGEGDTYSQEQAKRQVDPSKPSRDVVKERRVGLGDQGLTSKAKVPYWTPAQPLELDQVNMLDVGDRQDAAGNARDMAKFYFEIITPEESKFLYFRAHIKSLDDTFNADWQARKYNGRAENFYTYGGFDRDISLSFTIAAATRTEMRPLYRKMVYLASVTAPTYGEAGLMRGTLARMTVGSYLDQIPGVITSVKYNLVDGAPWEIAMGQPEGVETDVQVLPMVMDCSISFKPIHDFAPRTGFHHYFTNASEGVKFFEKGEVA